MNNVRKLKVGALLALAALASSAVFASSAVAFPTKTSPCGGCHDGPNVPVTATLASVTAASATYNVSAPAADAIAVFSGSTRLFVFSANTGQFSVAPGKTYSVLAVAGPGTSDGYGSTSVAPAAPVVDSTAPVTTSDAKSSYISLATIKLTATDAGSGVGATYYRLDGGAQTAGTTVATTVPGAHTVQFWSVDVAGNIEVYKTAAFTVTAPPVVDSTAPVTTCDLKSTYTTYASIKLTATDAGSGVAATYFKLDGGSPAAGTVIGATAPGVHTIEYWSIDKAGNTETHKTGAFTITAPPVPTDEVAPVTISDAKDIYVSSASIKLTATDAGSGVAFTLFRLDGGEETTGTAIACSDLGPHSIEFWSIDASGNVEVPKTASFTVKAPDTLPKYTESILTISSSARKLRVRRHVTLSGTLSPGGDGKPISVYVKKPKSKRWKLVTIRGASAIDGSGSSTWSHAYKLSKKGTYYFRASYAGDTASSPAKSVTVKVTAR